MSSKNIYTSTKVLPYVYIGIHRETGQFYIGSRTTKKLKLPPEQDLQKYRTSSKVVKPIFDEFDWYIVAMFFDPINCHMFEQELIYDNFKSPIILNKSCTYKNTKIFQNFKTKIVMSEKQRNDIRMRFIGVPKTEEAKLLMSEAKSKRYIIVYPSGECITIKNMTKFCINNNLCKRTMFRVCKGEYTAHKGFKCYRLDAPHKNFIPYNVKIKKHKQIKQFKYKITDPNGNIILVNNLSKFCKQNNLNHPSLSMTICGKRTHTKGFYCEYFRAKKCRGIPAK